MKIDDCHFDVPLLMISEGNDHMCVNGENGQYFCLFTEELLAERFKVRGQVIRVVESLEQLLKFLNALDPLGYAGVCFDLQQTENGPRSKFAFDWELFKEALRENIDAGGD